jgi:outer membrane protein insertion porin family
VDEWVGFVEITQGNFDITRWPPLGGGQKFRFRAQYGEKVHDYALSFVEPWFLNRQLALGFDLYDQWREEDEYDLERLGAATSLGVGLGGANRLNLRYRLEKVRLSSEEGEPYVDVEDNVFTYDEPKRVVSALTATLSRDTRDSVFVPTRGHRLYFTGTVMGGPLGFDTDLYNLEAGAAFHVPLWFRHVLSLRGRAEVVDVFGDTERVPLSERLFAGGPYTIRGFKYRWVGPRAKPAATPEGTPDSEVDWRPGGGQTLGVATVEYTVPVVTGIRLAGFYDTGNVWYDAFEFDLRHLAAGAGVGIRFDIPGFPMRIDYAWPVSRDDGWPGRAKHENWSFSIGYGF